VCRKWTDDDLRVLREGWFHYSIDEVATMLPAFTKKAIGLKASRLRLERSPKNLARMKQEKRAMLTIRNTTILGRARNLEMARTEALKYNSKTEMYRLDGSLYQYIRDLGMWDELCSHMIGTRSFNYSQTFLWVVLQQIFANEHVAYNDRQAIRPLELDIYIPSRRVAFEYDGSMFHSEPDVIDRDAQKEAMCQEQGITLYRIKEVREERARPEEFILHAISKLGFDVSQVDKDKCITQAFNRKITDKSIKDTVARYTTLKDFRINESPLYDLLCRRKLRGKYLANLTTASTGDVDEQLIIDCFLQCKNRGEVREKHFVYYSKAIRKKHLYPNAYAIYKGLPWKNSMRNPKSNPLQDCLNQRASNDVIGCELENSNAWNVLDTLNGSEQTTVPNIDLVQVSTNNHLAPVTKPRQIQLTLFS
jgi:very-short-patch-repair endonuclease